jgi:POT family proton-dependent oligopeptide transporter
MASVYPAAVGEGRTFLGHPRGLFVLFFTEMWERFSYYGMRALLVLYLTKHFLFGDDKAYLIYGAYTALVYIVPVIGGYLADRWLGQRKAVFFGAVLLVIGHFLMAFEGDGGADSPYLPIFYFALAFIIMGVGFLKANISAIVGALYPRDDMRRDPAFTIFYMGINLGAFLGALVSGYLGETYGWAYGFGAAGFGMLFGLIVFSWGRPLLEGHGEPPDPAALREKLVGVSREWVIYAGGILGVVICWQLIQYQELVGTLLGVFGGALVLFILYTSVRHLEPTDRDRIFAALALIIFSILFWALFEQAGSSLNVYADRQVDRTMMGAEVPASVFQSLNPFYIVLLGPVFAWMWTMLGRRRLEPNAPAKFGIGMILLGLGFLVLVFGANAARPAPTPVLYIFLIYLLHTMGELCLSPVGLSAMTKMALPRMVGLIMGTWFFASATGNFAAGLIARATGGGEGVGPERVTEVYTNVGWIAVGAGVLIILTSPLFGRLMHLATLGREDDALAGQREIGEPQAAGTRTDTELKPR